METFGLIFSRIHVTNSQGPPPKSLGKKNIFQTRFQNQNLFFIFKNNKIFNN